MEEIDLSFPPKQIKICQCKNCFKYHVESTIPAWVTLMFDSPDFIQYCLSFLQCPQNIEITRADIIHSSRTTSHSFLISLDLLIDQKQKRQAMVHYIVEDAICDFCESSLSSAQVQQWSSVVIISSYLDRTRPLQWLEKEIKQSFQKPDSINMDNSMSMNLFNACSSAQEMEKEDGKLIFRFNSKAMAFRLVSFIKRSIAIKIEETIENIPRQSYESDFDPEHDFNVIYSISLPGIWSDDLVCLPEAICRIKGSNSLCICSKVSDSISFIDPETGIITQISPDVYWDDPFPALLMKSSMVLFDVLSISLLGPKRGRTQMCDIEVELDRRNLTESSSIINNQEGEGDGRISKDDHIELNFDTIRTTSHLGNQLKLGDLCLGYDLRNGIDFPFGSGETRVIPEAIIVSPFTMDIKDGHNFFVNEFVKDGYNAEMIKKHLLVNKVPPASQSDESLPEIAGQGNVVSQQAELGNQLGSLSV